jgi:hypothetical protein
VFDFLSCGYAVGSGFPNSINGREQLAAKGWPNAQEGKHVPLEEFECDISLYIGKSYCFPKVTSYYQFDTGICRNPGQYLDGTIV